MPTSEGQKLGGVNRWKGVSAEERSRLGKQASAQVKNRYRPTSLKAKEMVRIREEKRAEKANSQESQEKS